MERIENLKRNLAIAKMSRMKLNVSKLSRENKTEWHTTKKYLNDEGGIIKRKDRVSCLDSYKDIIAELSKVEGAYVTGVYYYMTDEENFENPICCTLSNFRKYCKKYQFFERQNDLTPHPLFETLPGVQVQVDWVEMVEIIYITGEVEYVFFFSATLGYSRMHYFEPTKSKSEIDFKRCLINAFKYFGGTTRECLTDNMSCLVSFVNGKRLIHPSVKQFFRDIDVKIIFTKKSTPETKGKCESANRFIKRLKVYNGKIRDFNHLLSITNKLNYRINNEINQSIHVKPIKKFEKEKGTLKPLSNSKLLAWFSNTTLKQEVPSTCLVYYKTKKYSVHPKYIHKTVTFFEDNNVLQIICNNEVIAVHEITEKEINYSKEHYLAAFKKKKFGENIEEQAKKNLGEFK